MGLSKLSVGATLQRIAGSGQQKTVFNVVAALLGAWTIASVFAIALECNLTHPWITLHERCTGVVWSHLIDDGSLLTTGIVVCSMAGYQRF